MRILFLTPDVPEPPDQGAKLRNLALIRAAAAHHQVDVLSFSRQGVEGGKQAAEGDIRQVDGESQAASGNDAALSADLDDTESSWPQSSVLSPQSSVLPASSALSSCRRVITVPAPQQRATARRAWEMWFDQVPDLAHRLESPELHNALWDLLENERYDVVQIEGLEMIPYLGAVRGGAARAAVIYDAHNAEMTLQRTMWQAELRDPRRWHAAVYSFFQWSKLGTYERVMMNATDMVLAVSPEDAARLKGRHVDPHVVPNGVDITAIPFRNGRSAASASASLLFVGPLDYRPNADAVRWLVRSIFPAVRTRHPEVRLRLVGRGMRLLQDEGIDAVGYVDDVAAEYARATALVVPMRMGGGSRFKVLEAMAAGVPVVSTPAGMAGIDAEHERHVLIGRSTAELAGVVSRLLDDADLADRLRSAARKLVESRYDWRVIAPPYLRLLTTARRTARSTR